MRYVAVILQNDEEMKRLRPCRRRSQAIQWATEVVALWGVHLEGLRYAVEAIPDPPARVSVC